MSKRKISIYLWTGVLIVIGIAFLVNPDWREMFFQLVQLENLKQMQERVSALGVWGPVVMIVLMVVHSVTFIPAEVIMIANFVLFGPFLGLFYTWIGSMLGAYLSFYLARVFGRTIVKKFVSDRLLRRFDQFVNQHGATGLLSLRLIPVISFNALNYAAGFTNLSLWTFTWTTGLGILPMGILFAFLYQSAIGQKYMFVGLTVAGIAMLAIMIVKAKWSKKYELEKDK
jgi:uncharacterized membrane protein YdjX (TVP38/TMEM64 family)